MCTFAVFIPQIRSFRRRREALCIPPSLALFSVQGNGELLRFVDLEKCTDPQLLESLEKKGFQVGRSTRDLYYPHYVRWEHLLASLHRLGDKCSANVATRVALPQNRVETLIGSPATY